MQTLLLDRRTQDMIEGYVPEGEVLNDFSFSELKRWLTV